jgi:hypothetical protein
MHDASQQAAQARHCTLPRVTATGHLTVYGQPLHWPCRSYFVAFPRNSCAPAGPTRMGTGIALLVDRPGGKAIRTSSITETPTPPRGVPEGRQTHGARQGRPSISDRHDVMGMDQRGEAGAEGPLTPPTSAVLPSTASERHQHDAP